MQEYKDKLQRTEDGAYLVTEGVSLRGVIYDMEVGDVIEVPASRYNVVRVYASEAGFTSGRTYRTMRIRERSALRACRFE